MLAGEGENWVLGGGLFEDGLAEAGFEGDVQYAGASTTVKDQQDQISAMVTNGAKVIIIGAQGAQGTQGAQGAQGAQGGQLGTQGKDARDGGLEGRECPEPHGPRC